MRDEGEGVSRIFAEMKGSHLRPPELTAAHGVFSLTLRNDPIFTGPSPEWTRVVELLEIGLPQKRVLLAHPEGFTNADYQALNQVDRDEAYRQIQELVSLRIVRAAERAGPASIYRVAEDLRERLDFLRQRLPALRTFFSVTARLTNADYRALFGLTRHASRHELQRLVEQGFLRLEGEGRGAGYRPLPLLEVGGK
jgi:ATP-dependent DNA helicase RecG